MRQRVCLLFVIFAFLFFIPVPLFAASDFFYDFENNSFDGWTIINKKESFIWNVVEDNGNHYFGSKVGNNFSYTEAQSGDFLWDDYIFELDLVKKLGADINFFFRVRDERSIYSFRDGGNEYVFNWPQGYGIHISFGTIYLGKFFPDHYTQLTHGKSLATPADGIYHFRVVIYKNNFKVYESGNLVIDFTDTSIIASDDAFLKGRVALGVSTGAVAPTEVYFDNIRVTPIREPVVIIPGHGASINFGEMFLKARYPDVYTSAHLEEFPFPWHMMPGVKTYDPLINALENAGYEEGKDLFIFNYNWLETIRSENDNKGSAEKLADFLNKKLAHGQKANVVAHSMGGLVARTCLQQISGCPIDKLITVGTPHEGVVDTYGAWEGGEVWRPGLSKFAFSLVLYFARQEEETFQQAVQRLAPSTEEMLPTFPYLMDENGLIPYSSTSSAYPQNRLLSQLPPLESLGEDINLVYGEGKNTLAAVEIRRAPWHDRVLGKWSHGKPVEKKYSSQGDGTVLVQSARPLADSSGRIAGFNLDHSEIIKENEALEKIFSFLGLGTVSGAVLPSNATDYLAFYLLSPAYLEVNLEDISADDLFIGEEEVGKPKLIIIASPPANWQKEVIVKGSGEGEYILGVGLARGEKISWQEYYGKTKLNEEDKFLIEAADKITLKSLSSSGQKKQDEETLEQLKISLSSYPALLEKLNRLEKLRKINPTEALKYAYRVKNLASLEVKENKANCDLAEMNQEFDQLITYLEAVVEKEGKPYSGEKASLAYQETKNLLEGLEKFSPSPSPNAPFAFAAAQSLASAEESLPSDLPKNWEGLIRLGRGYFLGINSKILLN